MRRHLVERDAIIASTSVARLVLCHDGILG
jgi:hypothetical protein